MPVSIFVRLYGFCLVLIDVIDELPESEMTISLFADDTSLFLNVLFIYNTLKMRTTTQADRQEPFTSILFSSECFPESFLP